MKNPSEADPRKGLPSASSAERWMNCPGSHPGSIGMSSPSSEASERGDLLHEAMTDPETFESLSEDDRKACESASRTRAFIQNSTFGDVEVKKKQERRLWIFDNDDNRVASSQSDLVLFTEDSKALIINWKFGRGETEDALTNPQMKVEAAALACNYPLEEIYVAIIQPYALGDTYSVAVYDKTQLKYLHAEVVMKAKAAMTPNQPRIPGAKQCKWCPLAGSKDCPESTALALVQDEYTELTPATAGKLLDRCDQADAVIKSIRERAFEMLCEDSEAIEGWKIDERKPSLSALESVMRTKNPDKKVKEVKELVSKALEGCIEEKTFETTRRNIVRELDLIERLRKDFHFDDSDVLAVIGKLKKSQ